MQDDKYLAAMRTHWKRHKTFPSMAKLCDVLGLSSTSSVFALVGRLTDEGYPRVPRAVREEARRLLRHYPCAWEVERAHEAVPHLYGPALEKRG